MLRVIHTGGAGLPISYPVDPTAEFEPGMIAQLKIIGNDIVMGVSDGLAPYGMIDDIRTKSQSRQMIDEVVEITNVLSEIDGNNYRVSSIETNMLLENPNIFPNSFISSISVELVDVNGIIYVPEGTPLNYDFDGDGVNDGFRIIVSYTYRVPNQPGEDSTIGSGQISVHYSPGEYATDQFDPRQNYPLNGALFVGLDGKLTTSQPTSDHPSIGFVSGPPSAINNTLQFHWLG